MRSGRIFISYSRKDKTEVEIIYDFLLSNGYKPWMDTKDILGGEDWERAVFRTIENSKMFIFCISKNSYNRRGILQAEINLAHKKVSQFLPDDIFIIPLRLENIAIPEQFVKYQVIDWFGNQGPSNLLASIAAGLKRRRRLP